MSPAANTPSTFVMYDASRATFPRLSYATPRSASSAPFSGPTKPIASVTSSAGISRSVPGIGWNPFCGPSTSTSRSARTFPASSPAKPSVDTA